MNSTKQNRSGIDAWAEAEISLLRRLRRLLVDAKNGLSPFDGKTETTASIPQHVADLCSQYADLSVEYRGYLPSPQYRSKRPSDRIPRIDSTQLDPAIEEIESRIHAMDTVLTIDTERLSEIAAQVSVLIAERDRILDPVEPGIRQRIINNLNSK